MPCKAIHWLIPGFFVLNKSHMGNNSPLCYDFKMDNPLSPSALTFSTDLTCVEFIGKKVIELLQGLATTDVRNLQQDDVRPTLFCQHQGKVFAIGYLLMRQTDVIWLLTPPAHAKQILTRLVPHCQLARVKMHPRSVRCEAQHSKVAASDGSYSAKSTTNQVTFNLDAQTKVTVEDIDDTDHTPFPSPQWYNWQIQAQIPVLDEHNLLQFTPNQLNLVPSSWVSLKKGCYCGQEIIARTHHLGKVKRVLTRYQINSSAMPPVPSGTILTFTATGQKIIVLATVNTTQVSWLQAVGPKLSESQDWLDLVNTDNSQQSIRVRDCQHTSHHVSAENQNVDTRA
ncbi:MAG: hypothetical protein CMF43_04410 [Legionellales bacterium]|nr:hypothetical protein [Legionellales bacterium]